MRLKADLNHGAYSRLDQRISPLGPYSLGTGQRIHHQIPRIIPEQRRLPQHRHGIRIGRRPQPTHPIDQISLNHPTRITDPTMVHADVSGHQTRP